MTAPVLLTPKQIIRGGDTFILIRSKEGATLTCGSDTYTLTSGETIHIFSASAGTYACSASLSGYNTASQNVTVTSGETVEVSLYPSILPAEYQQVRYLKSDGVAYLQSNSFGVPSNSLVKIGFTIDYVINNADYNGCPTLLGFSGYMQIGYWNNTVTVGNANATHAWVIGQDYEAEVNRGALSIDGISTGLSRGFRTDYNTVFWNGANRVRGGVIRYIQRYDSNNTLQLNALPCYRKADSAPGLYDTIGDVFITNYDNTGTLIVGEEV